MTPSEINNIPLRQVLIKGLKKNINIEIGSCYEYERRLLAKSY